ncbi:MAG: UDP-N-acetylmuramoyl-tripeptide--D-alanyl-D-alanine ligase [Bdellovibrionales bacterium]|nr:UDP-N-acetylmuramoyl-tripeptide--D-alanyl-D-alanine ligase [Bdellovibrionales bacterium]
MKWDLKLDEILKVTGGQLLSRHETAWNGVGTDTRADLSGKLFIPLRGERFDAHDFIRAAFDKGAKGALFDRTFPEMERLKPEMTLIEVSDTLKSLQSLGRFWRRKNKAKIVAITGSSGKTTTKEFAASILQKKYKTHFSQGSYNNHWGVPITLLGIRPEHEVAVVEMGMNHAGEISELCRIAEPDITMVTNVGSAHIGELGSQEAVAEAKWEIYRTCPDSIQIYNLANSFTRKMHESATMSIGKNLKARKKIFTFSGHGDVDLNVVEVGLDFIRVNGHIGNKKGEVRIPIFGRHNVENTMAAAALALSLEMEPDAIWQALAGLKTSWGRNQLVRLRSGTRVLFDGYNANPESMAALLSNFTEVSCEGNKILVLGEMLELGMDSSRFHEELGRRAGNAGASIIWFMGPHRADFERGIGLSSFGKNLILSDGYKVDLASKVGSVLNESDIVALKGSRGMKLEQVLRVWNPVDFDG